jgi:hypothetical protein
LPGGRRGDDVGAGIDGSRIAPSLARIRPAIEGHLDTIHVWNHDLELHQPGLQGFDPRAGKISAFVLGSLRQGLGLPKNLDRAGRLATSFVTVRQVQQGPDSGSQPLGPLELGARFGVPPFSDQLPPLREQAIRFLVVLTGSGQSKQQSCGDE